MRRLLLIVAAAVASPAAAWQGARLLHFEPGTAHRQSGQTPVIDWQPAAPRVDGEGRVWLVDRDGSVRVILPWLGIRHRALVEGGLENGGVPTREGRGRLFVSRDGFLHLVSPDAPGAVSVGTGGLPTAVDMPCREGALHIWPDAHGGVTVLDDDGVVVERLEGELFRTRAVRGGAAVGCADGRMFAATAGGKLIGLVDGVPVWTAEPGEAAGDDWAPRVVAVDGAWWACGRSRGCLIVDGSNGGLRAAVTGVGSWEGPVALDSTRLAWIDVEGRLQLFDRGGNRLLEIDVALGPQQLLEPSGGNVAVLWAAGSDGALRRIDLERRSVRELYRAPSGFFAAGPVLHDGHAVLLTNFGAALHFQLR